MRWAAVGLAILLSACAEPSGPPLQDRGQLPEDIDAPPPEDYGEEIEFDAPGNPAIRGRVLAGGLPVAGARIWVEDVDIREPVDNLEAYEAGRIDTLTTTDRTGAFQFRLDGPYYHIAIEAPGHHLLRTERIAPSLEGDVQVFHLLPRDLMVIAHRGAAFYAPENTLPSLWKARWLGADSVEADVRLTADGQLVIFHDPTVERTTDGAGMVRDMTLAELQRLDAGSWFNASYSGTHIPTVEEFLAAAGQAGLHVVLDVKAPADRRVATWTATLEAIADAGAEDRVTFAVFREEGVQRCAARVGMVCAWLRSNSTGYLDLTFAAMAYGAHWLMVDHSLVDDELVRGARNHALKLHAWTLNHPDEWRPILAHGVDGIATDRMGYLIDDINGMPIDAP